MCGGRAPSSACTPGCRPPSLTTIRGRGYRFDPGADVRYRASALVAPDPYRVAVSGPVDWQTGCGGLPVVAHPLPVETYVPPCRYGWENTRAVPALQFHARHAQVRGGAVTGGG